MKASETVLNSIIEGQKQYLVPLFQRAYSWDKAQWEPLWENIVELCEAESPRGHFIGSIVTIQTQSVPEGVSKFLLIDGQQRLTTLFILLALLRDRAREMGEVELADEINDRLLINRYKKGDDYYRLLPTQVDRGSFMRIIRSEPVGEGDQVGAARDFFERKLKRDRPDGRRMMDVVTGQLTAVSIVLSPDDNPYLVFECLNARGMPLSPADLVRNLFFLKIHAEDHERVHDRQWRPMQARLGDNLTEFLRHDLMRGGQIIKQGDIYLAMKERVGPGGEATRVLEHLERFSSHYEKLINPSREGDPRVRSALVRLNRLEVTTAYPFLLNCFEDYASGRIDAAELAEVLGALENFVVRRFVCNIPSHGLNKVFPPLYGQAEKAEGPRLVDRVKAVLQAKGYPKDPEFDQRLREAKLYGNGDRRKKTALILESIEARHGHKEAVPLEEMSIEHVMPQSITDDWRADLGEDHEDIHESLLHTLGNLTLTRYNAELSNAAYGQKLIRLRGSHLEMNRYFDGVARWGREEIEARAEHLAGIALGIWPSLGSGPTRAEAEVAPKATPKALRFLNQEYAVKTWRDVLVQTLNSLIELEPDRFAEVVEALPKSLNADGRGLRETRILRNGFHVNVNASANEIRRTCRRILEAADLGSDEWEVETE